MEDPLDPHELWHDREEDHIPLVNAAAQPHAQLSPGGIGLQFDVHLLQRPAGAAVDPLLNVGAPGLLLQGPELLALLQGPEPVADHLAGAGLSALLQLILDELLEMLPDDVARRNGDLPAALS